jgi:ATP-dependent helicase/DNAse subunit B
MVEREREYRAFNRFIKLLDQISWILDYINATEKKPVSTYLDYLTLVFEEATYNLKEWSDLGVQVMPRLEILSINCQVLFIGGLVEGEFPRQFTRDIFFNDDERAMMGLHASEDLLSQDRFLFLQLLFLPTDRLYLTCPDFDADTKLLPSTFFEALKSVSGNIKEHKSESADIYVSRATFPEKVSLILIEGLSEDVKNLYRHWSALEPESRLKIWHEGIRILYRHKSFKSFSKYEGNLGDLPVVEQKIKQDSLKKPFSVTALESYLFCPMQYYLQRILNLEPEEEPESALTNLERGNAVHKILYLFYMNLDEEGKKKPWEYQALLERTANKVIDNLPYDDLLWTLEKENIFGYADAKGLLAQFLLKEKESISEEGFFPFLFETSFGQSQKSALKGHYFTPLKLNEKGSDIRLVGKIDRIDLDPGGRFMVIDYKTGQGALNIKIAQIIAGESLQIPLYLAVAEQILKRMHKKAKAAAGLYYLVKDSNNCHRKYVLINREKAPELKAHQDVYIPSAKYNIDGGELALEDIIKICFDHVESAVTGIANGLFRHTRLPNDKKCTSYCSYRRICRKDAVKIIALNQQETD